MPSSFLSKYMNILYLSPQTFKELEWRVGLQDSLVSTSFLAQFSWMKGMLVEWS